MGGGPRINIRGTTGAGKSTLAQCLAERLGVPHIELDALHHGANWAQPTREEFRARVQAAMAAAPDGWVIDGNYDSKLDSLVTSAADVVVWLDPPLHRLLRRVVARTFFRITRRVTLWNGNRESWRSALWGRDALIWWSMGSFFRHRREWPARGYVRLRSDREAQDWLERTVRALTAVQVVPP
jgi:adenylate kinase family enzyme